MSSPKGFVWRGIRFSPPAPAEGAAGFYSSEPFEVAEGRVADWKVHRPKAAWHARLRIGHERYPGVGETREQALDMAAAEAANVATYIVAMMPPASSPAPRKRRPRRAMKVGR